MQSTEMHLPVFRFHLYKISGGRRFFCCKIRFEVWQLWKQKWDGQIKPGKEWWKCCPCKGNMMCSVSITNFGTTMCSGMSQNWTVMKMIECEKDHACWLEDYWWMQIASTFHPPSLSFGVQTFILGKSKFLLASCVYFFNSGLWTLSPIHGLIKRLGVSVIV